MFYDNKKYFDFVKECRAIGIDVPIIPGLKPISSKKQLMTLPSIFHIDLPTELVNEVLKCKTRDAVRQLGVEWSIAQAKELIDAGAPVLHYYTMGNSSNIEQIAKAVF
jgi:methylenetetrahydrofolate reductase (NADPH)